MFSRIFSRIRNKLIISFLSVSGIPLICIGIFCYITISENMVDLVLDSEKDEVDASGRSIELFLESILNDTTKISKLESMENLIYARQIKSIPDISKFTKELKKDILSILEIKATYYHIEYIDENGIEIIRYNNYYDGIQACHPEALQDKSKTHFFRETKALAPGKIRVSDIHLNEEQNKIESAYIPVVNYSKSIYFSSGEFAGIINLCAFAENFLNNLSKTEEDEPSFHYLTDSQGYFFHHPNPLKLWGKTLNTDIRLYSEFPNIDSELVLSHDDGAFQSGDYLVSHVTVVPPGQSDVYWKLISMQEKKEMLTPILKLRLIIVLVTLSALLLAVLMGIILARNISVPVLNLAQIAERISYGELDIPIGVYSNDEIGQLAQSILRMRENLKLAIARLRRKKNLDSIRQ